jgi:hypothetical protein
VNITEARLGSPWILEASIGMAALCALLDVDESACVDLNAEELIMERGTGKQVSVVGCFPFVDRVRRAALACWVLELRRRPGDVAADQAGGGSAPGRRSGLDRHLAAQSYLRRSHRPVPAGGLCRLLGVSAPLSPVLLERGVNAVSGSWVVDVPAALRAVGEGVPFRQIPGKRLLTMMRREPVPGRARPEEARSR